MPPSSYPSPSICRLGNSDSVSLGHLNVTKRVYGRGGPEWFFFLVYSLFEVGGDRQ